MSTTENTANRGSSAPGATADRTRALLYGGVVSGPLFAVVAAGQILTRDGFDLRRHPISLLSLGDLGWIQIANFIVTGVLVVGCAVGLRRALGGGRGGTWGPRLVGLYGVGLIAGGAFLPDAALGFPPGTPDGTAVDLTWHGILHAVAPALAFLSLIAACLVFARRFAGNKQRAWALYSVATAVGALVLSAWPDMDGSSVRLTIAVVIGFAWLAAVCGRLLAVRATGR